MRRVRIQYHRNSGHAGRNFFKHLQPFTHHAVMQVREAGHVAAGASKRADKSVPHRIGGHGHDDWGSAVCFLRGMHRGRGAVYNENSGFQLCELDRERREPFYVSGRMPHVDGDVSTFDVAQVLQPLAKRV